METDPMKAGSRRNTDASSRGKRRSSKAEGGKRAFNTGGKKRSPQRPPASRDGASSGKRAFDRNKPRPEPAEGKPLSAISEYEELLPDSKADSQLVFGINPVLAFLEQDSAPPEALYVLKGNRNAKVQEIIQRGREEGVRPRFVTRIALDRLADNGGHQGIVMRASPRRGWSWEQLVEQVKKAQNPLLLFLDGVEDPRNLGAILRSAEAFGVMAVVAPKDRSAPLSGSALKASAGAGARMELVRVTNLVRSMRELQTLGIWAYGLDAEGPQALFQADFSGGVALVMGAEGKGLRRLTRETCDGVLSIPMVGETGSLNVSVAAGTALYEVQRQRQGSQLAQTKSD